MPPVKNPALSLRLLQASGQGLMLLCPLLAQAEVTFDNSAIVPPALHGQKLSGSMLIPATAGTQVGNNLFHSFNSFNINKGESVTFTDTGSTAAINNVIGRVTGNSPSTINGLLKSTINHADLYLFNPQGIVFGKNAQIDVRGAFHVSSGSSLELQAGGHIDALHPSNDVLTASPPQDFGFLNSTSGAVVFNGSQLKIEQALSVTSQHIALKQASISATGTTIALNNPDTSGAKNTITLSDTTLQVQATPTHHGKIMMHGGDVALDNSYVKTTAANTNSDIAGKINVTASNNFSLTGGFIRSEGEVGDIGIRANHAIHIANAGKIDSVANAGDTAGDITLLSKNGDITLDWGYVTSHAINGSATGSITVNAGKALSLLNLATISSYVENSKAGSITLNAKQDINLLSSARILGEVYGKGSAANITITSKNADIHLNDAYVSSTEFTGSQAGIIDINAANNLTMTHGAWVRSDAAGGGRAGSVNISTTNGDLLLNNAHISTMETHQGTAGTISVNAAKNLTLQNTGISSNADGGGTAGIVSVMTQTGDISLNNTQITSDEHLQGVAGTLVVSAGNNLTLNHSSKITSDARENGRAGDVTVIAKNGDISLNASKITSDAELHGNAGVVHVTAKNNLNMANLAHIASDAEGGGTAGEIHVQAASINLQDVSNISSTALAGGNSGLLDIAADNEIHLERYSSFSTASYGGGNAGDIKVHAHHLLYLLNSSIATNSSQGLGNGGSVAIDPTFVVLNNSQIIANALHGNGGNITISTQFFLPSASSIVQASSEFGLQGRVSINSTNANIAGSISLLTNTFANSAAMLQDSCGKYYNSSFIASASQHVLLSPDNLFDYVPSSLNHCH